MILHFVPVLAVGKSANFTDLVGETLLFVSVTLFLFGVTPPGGDFLPPAALTLALATLDPPTIVLGVKTTLLADRVPTLAAGPVADVFFSSRLTWLSLKLLISRWRSLTMVSFPSRSFLRLLTSFSRSAAVFALDVDTFRVLAHLDTASRAERSSFFVVSRVLQRFPSRCWSDFASCNIYRKNKIFSFKTVKTLNIEQITVKLSTFLL